MPLRSLSQFVVFHPVAFARRDLDIQALSVVIFSWLSDKYHQRAIFIALQAVITLVGMVLLGYAPLPGWRYAGKVYLTLSLLFSCVSIGVFLANAGSAGCITGILAYVTSLESLRLPRLIPFISLRTTSSNIQNGL